MLFCYNEQWILQLYSRTRVPRPTAKVFLKKDWSWRLQLLLACWLPLLYFLEFTLEPRWPRPLRPLRPRRPRRPRRPYPSLIFVCFTYFSRTFFFQNISEDINYDISVDTLESHGFQEYFSAKPTGPPIKNGMQPPNDAREIFMGCGLYRTFVAISRDMVLKTKKGPHRFFSPFYPHFLFYFLFFCSK